MPKTDFIQDTNPIINPIWTVTMLLQQLCANHFIIAPFKIVQFSSNKYFMFLSCCMNILEKIRHRNLRIIQLIKRNKYLRQLFLGLEEWAVGFWRRWCTFCSARSGWFVWCVYMIGRNLEVEPCLSLECAQALKREVVPSWHFDLKK